MCFKILIFTIILCATFTKIMAACQNATEKPLYYNKNHDNQDYILDNPDNLRIMDEVHDRMKFIALSGSLLNFMENVLVLGKYEPIKTSRDDLQSFILFVFDSTTMEDLNKVRDYWIRQLNKDEVLKNRPELTKHLLLKQNDVNAFIDKSFDRCKAMLVKVKTKDAFFDMLDFYGKKDYPGLVCLCMYFFDGLKNERNNFSFQVFSDILFERLKKESHYFGLPPKEVLNYRVTNK